MLSKVFLTLMFVMINASLLCIYMYRSTVLPLSSNCKVNKDHYFLCSFPHLQILNFSIKFRNDLPPCKDQLSSSLTYLQLSLDPSFAFLPKGHLCLVVLGHDLHKLPGQHRMLSKSHNNSYITEIEMRTVHCTTCTQITMLLSY